MLDSTAPLSDKLENLQTPLLEVDAQLRLSYLNGAAAVWLGAGLRRLLGRAVSRIAADGAELEALCRRAAVMPDGLRAQRQRFSANNGEARFAHVLARPGWRPGCVLLELHPADEFPGDDPAARLPIALRAALKGLAHEVKNPLAGLKGAAQLLRRRLADRDAERYLDVIVSETDRLTALMQRLLDPTPPNPLTPINIHEPLERVRLLAEAEPGLTRKIERDYDPSLPAIRGDSDRLTQALWNLVRNAMQAQASQIRLRTRVENAMAIDGPAQRLAIRVDVIDNGHGVPEALADTLFLPLVTGRADGTGLGLALTQQVAREHGGSLSYRSRPGHTVFTLLLPVGQEPGIL